MNTNLLKHLNLNGTALGTAWGVTLPVVRVLAAAALIAAVMSLGYCDSSSDDADSSTTGTDTTTDNTGPGNDDPGIELVTVIGTIVSGVDEAVTGATLVNGDPVAGADVFLAGSGSSDIVTTDASGNFSLQVPLSGALAKSLPRLDDQAPGSATRIFAWKTFSASERMGTAEPVTLDAETIDLGTLSLIWTTRAQFTLEINGDASCNTVVSIELPELPPLDSEPFTNTAGSCSVTLDYLPYNEDFLVELSATGFQPASFTFTTAASGSEPSGSSNWTFIDAADVPELLPE